MRACDYNCYKISYVTSVQMRGGPDDAVIGYRPEERTYLVVATDMNLAIAEFKRYHSKDELRTTELVGTLQGLVICH